MLTDSKRAIAELGAETHQIGRHKSLRGIDQTITLVDGSLVSAMPSILAASFFKQDNSTHLVKWRLHTHFEVDRGLPTRIDVTPDAGGDCDERAVMERTIEKDRLYVMDTTRSKYKGTSTGPSSDGILRIATNLLDVPTALRSSVTVRLSRAC